MKPLEMSLQICNILQTSINAFAEEEKPSGILSGLKQLGASLTQDEQELLPPDQAFKLTIKVRNAHTLIAEFEPTKNYYLYKDKITFKPILFLSSRLGSAAQARKVVTSVAI